MLAIALASRRSPRHAAVWTLLAAATGLLSSALLSSVFHLGRAAFVLGHGLAVLGFSLAYVPRASTDLKRLLLQRWAVGVLGGMALGAILIRGVTLQPESEVPSGWALVAALAWYGVVYGLADAILLNVVPVLAANAVSGRPWYRLPALLGTLFVTALYHVGFAEFRGVTLTQPLIGNAIITAGYLVTGNPLTPLLAHVIMHSAAVVHGMETTSQLPPHYPVTQDSLPR